MTIQATEISARAVAAWRTVPGAFQRDIWPGFKADGWQRQASEYACRPVQRKRLALQSAGGVGKTCWLAQEGWRRLNAYGGPGKHPKGAAVAMDRQNLEDNLWAELARWRNESRYLRRAFEMTSNRIYARDHPETWFLSARGWSKRASVDEQGRTLSGLRSAFPFALFDESANIPQPVVQTGEQMLSNCQDGLLAQTGNPTSLEGALYRAAVTERTLWELIRITGDPDDPNRSSRVDIDWAREQIALKGPDDPWVQALIFGNFPDGGLDTLLTLEEVEEAMARVCRPEDIAAFASIVGIDAARKGLDQTSYTRRQGRQAWKAQNYRNMDGRRGASIAAGMHEEEKVDRFFIDNTGGWGASIYDHMVGFGYGKFTTPVEFSGKAADPRFFNKRTEMWWEMAEWVKGGGCLDPRATDLIPELTTPTVGHKGDRLLLMPKDIIRKLLPSGRSPDEGDSLALTFAQPVAPPGLVIERMRHHPGMGAKARPRRRDPGF